MLFAVKAIRYATHRTVLAEAGEAIGRFVASGIVELGPKLGPLVWQFASNKRFDPADFERFLQLLPPRGVQFEASPRLSLPLGGVGFQLLFDWVLRLAAHSLLVRRESAPISPGFLLP